MSTALEKFRNSLVYAHTATAAEVVADLEQIQALDKTKESETKKFGCLGALLVPLAIAGALFGAMIHPALSVTSLVLFGGGAVFLLMKAYAANKGNVEDRRYRLLRSLVDLLSRDMAADAMITVSMSLKAADRKANFVTEGKTGHWNYKLYHDNWLSLEAKLLDGTACRIQVTERRQNRYRWKRSASGKSKYKTKVKAAMEVALRLKPKTRKYSNLSEIGEDPEGAVQLPSWAILKGLTVQDGGLMMKSATKTQWDAPGPGEKGKGPHGVHLIAMSMLSLYQILNLSRAVTKSQANSPGDSE